MGVSMGNGVCVWQHNIVGIHYTNGKVGIKTSIPDRDLQVVGTARIGESTTNYIDLQNTGSIVFYGSSGVCFGEIYNEGEQTTNTVKQNIWYKIPIKTEGEKNNTTLDTRKYWITTNYKGRYKISFSWTGYVDKPLLLSNKFEFELRKNGITSIRNFYAKASFNHSDQEITLSGHIIYELNPEDNISLWVKRTTSGSKINLKHLAVDLNILQVGG